MKFAENGINSVDVRLELGGDGEDERVPLEILGPLAPPGKRSVPRIDEYDVDFSDTKIFTVQRWEDILKIASERLSASDHQIAAKYVDWQELSTEIQTKFADSSASPVVKRQFAKIQPLPHVLATLMRIFSALVAPHEVNYELIWGLVYLNLKLSYTSPERLKRTTDLLNRMRRSVELFIRCLELCSVDNEARIAAVDFLDPIMIIFTDSITYLHDCSTDREADQAWPDLNDDINTQLGIMEQTRKHVNDITSLSAVNQDRKIKSMSLRHAPWPENEEYGAFPNLILPFRKNPKFYGRKEELDRIQKYLSPKGDQSYRTYTIYGRRGVGKTEIALQFAYTNPAGYDAIFWIQCETSVSIRQSFTDVAVSLNLPGADKNGRHEENLLAVKDWLKKTHRRWLLIFDNAENAEILRGYWPIGASGAILLTSRNYYNFTKDLERRGDTVKPFDTKQSWELLLHLLGDDWKRLERQGKLSPTEVAAAKGLLEKLEGLALAIQQAATLIKDPEIGGPTIARTFEMFKERIRNLPERYSTPRSTSEKALDALWDMTFNSLTSNARALLGVLAWFSPDSIQAELFHPRKQKVLDGKLEFCKQDAIHLDSQNRASLVSLITPSSQFANAVNELQQRELIKKENIRFSVHRVVQEAINYQNLDDLQESFETAAKLVYEQFPKREMLNETYFTKWGLCQEYIIHGVHLSKNFQTYSRSGVLKGSKVFVKLLANCGWYLHELGDYDVSARVIETATAACEDKSSLIYSDLRSTAGSRFYDWNRLADCRKAWEDSLKIRRELLSHDSHDMAAIYNNLGNLELASGNTDQSTEYFNRAIQIYESGGDKTATSLGITYLCIGRVNLLRRNLKEALRWTNKTEALFIRTIGSGELMMAHVHYLYGNIFWYEGNWSMAYRSYEKCLRIALDKSPLHPLTASAYYSLGCAEFEMKHPDAARSWLDKAMKIAELRSPNRDDGPIARILWKTAVVLESEPLTYSAKEAAELRKRAVEAQADLLGSGEGGEKPFIDEDGVERNEEEDGYDVLVPLFFR